MSKASERDTTHTPDRPHPGSGSLTLNATMVLYLSFTAWYRFCSRCRFSPPMCVTWMRAASWSVVSRAITSSGHSKQDMILNWALLTHLHVQ